MPARPGDIYLILGVDCGKCHVVTTIVRQTAPTLMAADLEQEGWRHLDEYGWTCRGCRLLLYQQERRRQEQQVAAGSVGGGPDGTVASPGGPGKPGGHGGASGSGDR